MSWRTVILLLALILSVTGCSNTKAMQKAAEQGDLVRIKELLKEDPGLISCKNPMLGATPLELAAMHRQENAVALLLASGADANAVDNFHGSTLQKASILGYEKIAEMLLAHHADVNARDIVGITPCKIAMLCHHPEMAEFLRQHGGHE